jgi:phage protein D
LKDHDPGFAILIAMNVHKVKYEIVYNGKNITGDILPHVISFSYTDKSHGEADEISIVLEDKDNLWKSDWYPTKGDTVTARILHPLQGTLECGTFTVDEISGEGSESGDTFTIKAISAGINKKLRTKKSYAHENKTLREIANHVAGQHGLKVEGTIADVRITRVTQYRKSDLSFLRKLAGEYGYTFSIRDQRLIFTSIFELEKKAAALTIHRTELLSWSITDKTSNTYKGATVSYHNPRSKKVVKHTTQESEEAYKGAKVDTLELRVKAENPQQAEIKSRVALYRANSLQQEGNISLPGNVYAVAGVNCEVDGIGMFSGLYYLDSSTHSVDASQEYTTDGAIKRVGLVAKTKQKKEKKKYEWE